MTSADDAGPESSSEVAAGSVSLRRVENPDGDFLEGDFTVQNAMGLHVRPATKLALSADQYSSTDIWLIKDGTPVDAKTPLLILTLAGVMGTEYTLRARGPQAEEALRELLGLAERKFDVEGD